MKDTSFSLDIIFINSERRIVQIVKNTEPYSETMIKSHVPVKYVVEVNSDFCNANDILVGYSVNWRYK